MNRHAGIRLLQMQKDNDSTDVTFKVQGTDIKAHRIVFISCGGLLRQLIESKENDHEISDVTPETFQQIIEYLYTDACRINQENVFELLHASKVLGLTELEKRCAQVVKGELAVNNVGEFASQALQFKSDEYLNICMEYFQYHTHEVIKTDEFLNISNEALEKLLSSDSISCSELDMFKACIAWAKKECERKGFEETPENLRQVLGNVLKRIRFPAIPLKDTEDHIVPLKILSHEEVGRLVYEVKTGVKETDFMDKDRTNVVKVTVKGYETVKGYGTNYQEIIKDSTLTIPLSSTISEVKKMKIFWGGQYSGGHVWYPLDGFTLGHKGKELSDDTTLYSIYTPGQDLVLKPHTFTYTIRENTGKWEFPLTFKVEDRCNEEKFHRIIRGHLYAHRDIHPDRVVDISYPQLYVVPGSDFTVTVKQ